MEDFLYVRSAPGTNCPLERCNGRDKCVPQEIAIKVPNKQYYRRLISDGSLIKCEEPSKKEIKPKRIIRKKGER